MRCDRCEAEAVTFLRYDGSHLCRDHFLESVERRVKRELRRQVDLAGPHRIAIALSGGKDSTTCAYLLHAIFARRRDIHLVAVTVDEGIASYRPGGIAVARQLCEQLGIEQRVLSYEEAIGWRMDDVVRRDPETIPCSYCGVFRRSTLNRLAAAVEADYVATGHNLDDVAQSILMNVARADVEKLARMGPHAHRQDGLVPRLLPLRTIPEKETYLYALLRGLPFHDATCPYAERSQRARFRAIVEQLEDGAPGTRFALLRTHEELRPFLEEAHPSVSLQPCQRCGQPTVEALCQACAMAERLAAA